MHSISVYQVEEGSDICQLNNYNYDSSFFFSNLEFLQVDFNLVTYTRKRIESDILNWKRSKHAAIAMKPIEIYSNTRISELHFQITR